MEKQTKGHIERFEGNLWVCDSCGFGFPAYHNDGSPHAHSCPNCAETHAKALATACQGIPVEALTPGSIKALLDVVTSAMDAMGNLRVNDFADDNSFAVVGSSLQNLREALTPFVPAAPAPTEPAPITLDELKDMLDLIAEDYSPSALAGWTQVQREEAATWAGAVYLEANDNPVKVPPKPAFLTSGGQ